MSTHLIPVLEEVSTAGTSTPIYTGPAVGRIAGSGSHLFRHGMQALYSIGRAGTTGNLTIYGSNAADPNGQPSSVGGNPAAQTLKGDGSTTNFQTAIPYVALSNFNWIVVVNGVIQAAAAISAITSVTVGGVALARVDFASAPAANAEILVFYSAVSTIYAAANDRAKKFQAASYDFVWTLLGATPSACSLWMEACGDG